MFGGDGDAFSIGGNRFTHTARKNVKMTYVVMDNFVYGLTKSRPLRRRRLDSSPRPTSGVPTDRPVNPLKQAISRRGHVCGADDPLNPNHVLKMMEAAMDHDGFGFIECLSECVEFFPGADSSNPRKGGQFRKSPRNMTSPTNTRPIARLDEPFPAGLASSTRTSVRPRTPTGQSSSPTTAPKVGGLADWQILQKSFDRTKWVRPAPVIPRPPAGVLTGTGDHCWGPVDDLDSGSAGPSGVRSADAGGSTCKGIPPCFRQIPFELKFRSARSMNESRTSTNCSPPRASSSRRQIEPCTVVIFGASAT